MLNKNKTLLIFVLILGWDITQKYRAKNTYTPWVRAGLGRPVRSRSWLEEEFHDDQTCPLLPRATARPRPLHIQTAGTSNRNWGWILWHHLWRSCSSDWCHERWTWTQETLQHTIKQDRTIGIHTKIHVNVEPNLAIFK